jgi:hypothetical protein
MADKPRLDPHTARVVKELRAIIGEIESGVVVLRRSADVLTEESGLHREISLRVTVVPARGS